jgi:hypothetical protein
VTSGSAQTVSLSASGLPSGATMTFNPASVTAGNSSTATLSTTTSTPAGTYPITITGTGPSATHTTTFTLTVSPAASTNLALGKTMTASGSVSGFPPSNANDNNTSSYWESTNNAFPQWLQVDLTAPTTVSKIKLTLPPSTSWATRTQTLSVLGSTNGTTFTTLVPSAGYTFNPATGNTVTITFTSTSTRYLRLNITANTGWPAGQISEFQVYTT